MDSVEELRERFAAMSYQELRQEAKKHGVKANLKKTDMVEQIVQSFEQENADIENMENIEVVNETLNRTFEIENSVNKDLLSTLGDVSLLKEASQSPDTDEEYIMNQSMTPNVSINSRKRPETISKHFAALHDKLCTNGENLSSFMERKRARHASLTRGVSSRTVELAKPKVVENAKFTVQDIEKLNFDFSRTEITPRKITKHRASSHGPLHRIPRQNETPKPLDFSDKSKSRSVDRLRMELLAKPKQSHANTINNATETPIKPILRAPKISRSSSANSSRPIVSNNAPALNFDESTDTPKAPIGVNISSRIEQLAKPKTPIAVKKPAKVCRSKSLSYKPYLKPFVYVDTTKMTDAQLREHLAAQKKPAS